MSKKFKAVLCAYCADAQSATADHVFAREFFLVKDRSDLPKVPACQNCNRRKSQLEHYALSVLPFGGQHQAAHEHLATRVGDRLRNNKSLHRELAKNRGKVWFREGSGVIAPRMIVPIKGETLKLLFELVAQGLAWHHWRTYFEKQDSAEAIFLNEEGDRQFTEAYFCQPARSHVQCDLGNGTIQYEGRQAVDRPQASVWRIRVFGGVCMSSGDPHDGICRTIGVITCPSEGDHI